MHLLVDINSPATNFCTPFDTISSEGTAFPYTYEIDYIKVWQLKQECDRDVYYCNLFSSNFICKLFKSVNFGGINCNTPINNQGNLSFYATDCILLDKGTIIDNNSNVIMDIKKCELNQGGYKSASFPPNPPPPAFIEKLKRQY